MTAADYVGIAGLIAASAAAVGSIGTTIIAVLNAIRASGIKQDVADLHATIKKRMPEQESTTVSVTETKNKEIPK